MKSKRQAQRDKRRRQKIIWRAIWITAGALLVAVIAFILIVNNQPAIGESVPVMANVGHVEEGQDPGPFNSNPPTSGRHYAGEFDAGFYEENSPEAQLPFPEGYLVHNLEHGYVIFWYNCEILDLDACSQLKDDIQQILENQNYFKVIAFPRPLLESPVVMTSWGQIIRFEQFDPQQAELFVERNRNKAPEPDAP